MKHSILVLALLSVVNVASATGNSTPSNNCNGNGSCSQDTVNNTSNNTTNQGGGGGSASIQKGAVQNTIETEINVSNKQGQIQGQQQGQAQSIKNSGNSNSNASASVGEGANANSNNTNVSVGGDTYEAKRNPVATAYAPSIAPTANCALSINAGIQVMGFGGSFGKAYTDENCVALEAVRSVSQVLGDKETAEAMMCQNKAYAKARATAGRACPVEQE
jgi:hypothetical protein